MVSKLKVDAKAKLLNNLVLFECICASHHYVKTCLDEPVEFTCGDCNTQWVIRSSTKIRKTSQQINRELGYDTDND